MNKIKNRYQAMKTRLAKDWWTATFGDPISWLIPCHRVVRKNGRLGGYHWGMNIKVKMLDYERFFNINY